MTLDSTSIMLRCSKRLLAFVLGLFVAHSSAVGFGGRPTPAEPEPPAAPDVIPEDKGDPGTTDGWVDPNLDPSNPPIYLIEPQPDEIWSPPVVGEGEIAITAAPDETHSPQNVPEPATVTLAGLGIALVAWAGRRRKRT